MSTLKVNNLQVGQDSTATNNLTWFQPGSPDGTIRLGSGNAGSATTKFTFDKDGNLTCVGDITANSIIAPIEGTLDDWIVHAGDTNTKFGFPADDTFTVETGGSERLRIKSDGTVYTVTQGAKFGISQDPTLTTMGSTSGTWQVPEVDGSVIGAEMRIGDHNTNSTAIIRLASYGSGNGGVGGGAIMFTNTRNGSASFHSDIAAIKGARESLGKGYLRFFTANQAANTEKMRITSDGKIGINQTSPERILHVGKSGTAEANIRIQGGADYAELRVKDSDNAFGIHTNIGGAGSRESFSINGSTGLVSINSVTYQALDITTSENGTNGPELQLIHNSASPAANDCVGQIRFKGKDSAGNTDLMARIQTIIEDPTSGQETAYINFGTRGYSSFNPIFRLKNRGTASAPSYTADDHNGIILDVYNSGSGTGYARYMNIIAKSAGNTDSNILFWTEAVGGSPTEKIRIDQQGRLGINSPALKGMLEVRASGGATDKMTAVFGANEGTTAGTLTDNTDKACRIGVQHYDIDTKPFTFLVGSGTSGANTLNIGGGTSLMNGATVIELSTDSGTINNGGTKRVQVTSDGTLHKYLNSSTIQASFGGSGQVNGITGLPSSAGTPFVVGRDTGTNRSAHFGGHLSFASGFGLNFQASGTGSGTVTSHILDDYEEGTWNPVITNASGTDCGTYSWRTGEYTKIGNVCYVTFALGLGGLTNASAYKLRGLPFTMTGFNYFYYIQAHGYNWNSGYGDSGSDASIFLECNAGSNNQLNIVQGSGKGNAGNTHISASQRLSGMFWFYTA